jgi:hypothetical protein
LATLEDFFCPERVFYVLYRGLALQFYKGDIMHSAKPN